MSGIFGAGQLQFLSGGDDSFYGFEIGNSLRFNDDDSARLTFTPASAGNRKTFTWSAWIKRSELDADFYMLFTAEENATNKTQIYFDDNHRFNLYGGGPSAMHLVTTQVFRDPSAWYHIVTEVDTTQGTASDRVNIYVNGSKVTAFSTETYPNQNIDTFMGAAFIHAIGVRATQSDFPFDGYLAEFNFIDGSALGPTSFGETKENIWIPKDTSGLTFGTNGFRLQFKNSSVGSASSSTVGADTSGNNHHFSSNNIATTDNMTDSPTDNFCTFNPLLTNDNSTFSDGNLQVTSASGASTTGTTFGMSSGKWYAEFICTAKTSVNMYVGIVRADRFDGDNQGNEGNNIGYIYVNDISGSGRIYYPTGDEAYGAAWAVNDVIGVAFDADTRNVTFYKNGVSQGVYTRIASEYSGGTWMMVVGEGQSSATATFVAEFGQGGFTYTPPTDYLALSTANLPDPVIDPAQGSSPADYFSADIWSGNSASSSGDSTVGQVISSGFQPDWIWTKERNNTGGHKLFDTVRGLTKQLSSNSTAAEETRTGDDIVALSSSGYTLGTNTGINYNGRTYVGWSWKAGGSGVSNTDGSITSTVSANTESGFSIVSYSPGTGNTPCTVGHGLNSQLEMYIIRSRSAGTWWVYHTGLGGAGNYLRLQETNAVASNNIFNATDPTSTVFSHGDVLSETENFIAYCFHSVDSYSKISSYVGNGSSDGVFVFTGFRPSWLMVKKTDGAGVDGWTIVDNKRDTFNVMDQRLQTQNSNAEGGDVDLVDFLSNGFKIRYNGQMNNQSGTTYIYMCFAEQPFKFSNAR